MTISFPLAFGFATPGLMLAGAVAASIPIILHLLNKRKYREEPWAAMRFLMAAIRKNQRRVRVENWLLLAVRTLIIVLVAAAMARPFLENGGIPLIAGQRTHRVFVLDGSLSMAYASAETTRFDQAKELAQKLIKAAKKGDALSLVLMADPPRVIIGDPSPNHEEVAKELREVTLPHGGTDLAATFEAVDRVLGASSIAQKEVVFLTDLQAASWRRPGDDDGLKRALAKLQARKPQSVVIDLGAPGGSNRAVVDLKLGAPVVTAGMSPSPRLSATIRAFGATPADSVRARLIVDGRVGPEMVVNPRPGEDATADFAYDFASPGEHLVEVLIDDDPLKLDNQRWISVPVRESLRVLLVDGDPKAEAFRSETDFLATALSPEPESPGSAPPIKVEVVSESQLAGRDLTTYDAVALCNVAQVTSRDVATLDAYLKQGGGLVVFGGDQVVAENYNRLLFDGGKGLLPAEIGPIVGSPEKGETPFQFRAQKFTNPIVADFDGAPEPVVSSLTRVNTSRFQKLKIPAGSAAQVALAFQNDDPAIIEAPKHRGRVIQVATSADTGWTTWPTHLSYPAVMEKIVLLAASGRLIERNVRVGQPIDQALPASAASTMANVRRPDGRNVEVKLRADGDVSRLHFEETDLSGGYQARVGPPVNLDARFAANPDPIESDPAKLDRAALASALPGWDFAYFNEARTLLSDTAAVSRRGEFHRPLLWLVLALLIIESILAYRFGHHSSRSR